METTCQGGASRSRATLCFGHVALFSRARHLLLCAPSIASLPGGATLKNACNTRARPGSGNPAFHCRPARIVAECAISVRRSFPRPSKPFDRGCLVKIVRERIGALFMLPHSLSLGIRQIEYCGAALFSPLESNLVAPGENGTFDTARW